MSSRDLLSAAVFFLFALLLLYPVEAGLHSDLRHVLSCLLSLPLLVSPSTSSHLSRTATNLQELASGAQRDFEGQVEAGLSR